MSKKETPAEKKRRRLGMANKFKVGMMVEFKDHYHERKRGFIAQRNNTQFVIEHPSGENWSVWVEQIITQVWELKWPGLCTTLRDMEHDPRSHIDRWKETLQEIRQFASLSQKKMIDGIIAPLEYVGPLIEQDIERESYEPSEIDFEIVPVEEVA